MKKTRTLLLLLVALSLTACNTQADHLVKVYENSAGAGYVSGDGRIIQLTTTERGEPVHFSGTLDTGKSFDSRELNNRVAVINFWYASCPPCRLEAGALSDLRENYPENEVAIFGVNVRDTKDVSLRFAKDFAVSYPSILDATDNTVQLAFADASLPPNAVPTTLILDDSGRVAARISGLIESPSVVVGIIDELLSQKS